MREFVRALVFPCLYHKIQLIVYRDPQGSRTDAELISCLLELFTARTILVYLNLLRKLSINIPRTILVSRY